MREVFLLLENSMMLFILQVFIATGSFLDALYDEKKLANWRDEKQEEMFVCWHQGNETLNYFLMTYSSFF